MTFKFTRRQTLLGGAGAVGAIALPGTPALAADWMPERPITVAMTAPAGGATDRGIRPILERLTPILGGSSISVQDMSGAGGVQAIDYVMNQPPDGYTWAGMNGYIEYYAMLGRHDYTYRDFDFWMAGGTACAIAVRANSGIETFDQFLEWVRSKPGELSCAVPPTTTEWANVAVYIRDFSDLGLDFKIANYRGGGPAVRAFLAGETDFAALGVTAFANFMRSDDIRCLAGTTPEDWNVLGTTIPSLARWIKDPVMVKTLPWTNIHGIAVRKEVPEEIKATLDKGFAEVMEDESMLKIWDDNAFFPFKANREAANALMKRRTELQTYIIEVLLGAHQRTRDELGIDKLEETL